MMNNNQDLDNNMILHWVKNLVGSSGAFLFNLTLTILFGLLYAFKFVPSPVILLIFGIVSPVIFTICLYQMLLNKIGLLNEDSLPKAFISRSTNKLMMFFDLTLIVGFAMLIYFDILNNFFFRFLQLVFFPVLLLLLLRIIYIGNIINNSRDDF